MNLDYIKFEDRNNHVSVEIDVLRILASGINALEVYLPGQKITYCKFMGTFTDSYFNGEDEVFFEKSEYQKTIISYNTFIKMFARQDIYGILDQVRESNKIHRNCQLADKPQ